MGYNTECPQQNNWRTGVLIKYEGADEWYRRQSEWTLNDVSYAHDTKLAKWHDMLRPLTHLSAVPLLDISPSPRNTALRNADNKGWHRLSCSRGGLAQSAMAISSAYARCLHVPIALPGSKVRTSVSTKWETVLTLQYRFCRTWIPGPSCRIQTFRKVPQKWTKKYNDTMPNVIVPIPA